MKKYGHLFQTRFLFCLGIIIWGFGIADHAGESFALAPTSQKYPQSVGSYWQEEIRNFSKTDRIIFDQARTVRGIRVGMDIDGTLLALKYDRCLTHLLEHNGKPMEESLLWLDRFAIRPGYKALLIGLLFHNEVHFITANELVGVKERETRVPFLKKLFQSPRVSLQTAKEIEQCLHRLGKKFEEPFDPVIFGFDLSPVEREKLLVTGTDSYFQYGMVKIPEALGVDLLIDDYFALETFNLKLTGNPSILKVPAFSILIPAKPGPFTTFKMAHYENDPFKIEDETFGLESETDQNLCALKALRIVTRLKKIRKLEPGFASFENLRTVQYAT